MEYEEFIGLADVGDLRTIVCKYIGAGSTETLIGPSQIVSVGAGFIWLADVDSPEKITAILRYEEIIAVY